MAAAALLTDPNRGRVGRKPTTITAKPNRESGAEICKNRGGDNDRCLGRRETHASENQLKEGDCDCEIALV